MERFDEDNFPALCAKVGAMDTDLQGILDEHGLPPLWVRENSFETLVLTILEQQVSLASAYAAYQRLKARIHPITPQALLSLSDEDLRACSFTRQKAAYARGLATAMVEDRISLQALAFEEDAAVRRTLTALKGIGDWTADIYLLHALRRTDIFPIGDLALVNAFKAIKGLPKETPKEELVRRAEAWRPYRSVATMILWHWYIRTRGLKVSY
jgi:DNA-3-methyladenine glycosylase II